MEKELKINVPEGYEIDREKSTFECIKLKPVVKKWRETESRVTGYRIDEDNLAYCENIKNNNNVFATKKQAKSALAMAQISQIMANDERFGGPVTKDEVATLEPKPIIVGYQNEVRKDTTYGYNIFLAFHTEEQRDLFLEENEDLVKDYLMID